MTIKDGTVVDVHDTAAVCLWILPQQVKEFKLWVNTKGLRLVPQGCLGLGVA